MCGQWWIHWDYSKHFFGSGKQQKYSVLNLVSEETHCSK